MAITKENAQVAVLEQVTNTDVYKLVLYNDEVNTFDWVIESLIDICDHTEEQAEQCAWIVHTKGKYVVKNGSYTFLEPRYLALAERGLTVELQN